jgi:ADP-ribose pyrophosphatase
MPEVIERRDVFTSSWFDVVAKTVRGVDSSDSFYSLRLADYVTILPVTQQHQVVLVRQYRPAVEQFVVELPSGTIEPGESPQSAAERELTEETGYGANCESLGCLVPDTGRLGNRLWCFYGHDAALHSTRNRSEPGVELIVWDERELWSQIKTGGFNQALHLAVILLAVLKNKLRPA